MRFSTRIINFAASISIVAAMLLFAGCEGRTAENMTPAGDTIEVTMGTTTDTRTDITTGTRTDTIASENVI